MSLQAILEQIQQASAAQVQEVLAQAEREVEAELAEARARSEQVYQAAYRQALAPEAAQSARIINQAHFEAECLVGQARERLVEQVLERVREQLSHMRGSDQYPEVLRRILYELLPGGNGLRSIKQNIVIEADPRDRDLLEGFLREKAIDIPVEYSLSCWGGLCAHSPDGTVRMINTLESRLERALPFLKQRLSAGFELRLSGEKEKVPFKDGGL